MMGINGMEAACTSVLVRWAQVYARLSTPFRLILQFQQDEKRSDARRASAGLAMCGVASERNTASSLKTSHSPCAVICGSEERVQIGAFGKAK